MLKFIVKDSLELAVMTLGKLLNLLEIQFLHLQNEKSHLFYMVIVWIKKATCWKIDFFFWWFFKYAMQTNWLMQFYFFKKIFFMFIAKSDI